MNRPVVIGEKVRDDAPISIDHDPIFDHAVVYLTRLSDDDKVRGLIVSHPSPLTVQSLVQRFRLDANMDLAAQDAPILVGGPANASSVFYLTKQSTIGVLTEKKLHQMVLSEEPLQTFLGYCTWLPEQLNGEIQQGYWEVLPPTCGPHLLKQPLPERHKWAQQHLGIDMQRYNCHRIAHG